MGRPLPVEPEQFCEYFEEHLRDLVPDRLVQPLASLMQSRMEINSAERAFGSLNKDRSLESFRKDADAIREALNELWSEL